MQAAPTPHAGCSFVDAKGKVPCELEAICRSEQPKQAASDLPAEKAPVEPAWSQAGEGLACAVSPLWEPGC